MRCLHFSLSASWLLTAALATAQIPNAAEQAKARWKDGTAALARGDAEGARVAFQQAYDLLPDAELAQGLGEVEFRTGHFADAARHLTLALENRQLAPEERKTSTRSLQKALTKVSRLYIDVSVTGAELRIDGEPVTLPRETPWFLDSGPHTIVARRNGYLDSTQYVTATPGQEIRVSVTLSPELNQEMVKPAPDPQKDVAPKPLPTKAPPVPVAASSDPSNRPPLRFFIGEGAIALGAIGSGTYFALKPNAENNDRAIGATLIGCGSFVAVGTFVIWLATRPSTPLTAKPGISVGPASLGGTF